MPVQKNLKASAKKISRFLLAKLDLTLAGVLVLAVLAGSFSTAYVFASNTSTFNQTVNPGTLSADIVDSGYNSVGSPSVTLDAVDFSFTSQTSGGTFGTTSEQLYVSNGDAADSGWNLTVAASNPTDTWSDGGTNEFDFNDSSGATDGGDADSVGGQMTVDPSGATLDVGACSSCTTTNITVESSASFTEGTTDDITLLTAAAGSDDIGDWTLQGVQISQAIPAEQAAAAYTIDLVITANLP